ncbi:beta-1,3-galactosyltransferase 5-like [Ostrea edulis]|uniref:beta-1,3-galactosyltransferase 5-like n=1 Tax=Ostrea edulis TaxID=37623 RepID=UPI0020954324|nr:beta-1,3-galactosyltransferase 5-like [Ostrea edulis]
MRRDLVVIILSTTGCVVCLLYLYCVTYSGQTRLQRTLKSNLVSPDYKRPVQTKTKYPLTLNAIYIINNVNVCRSHRKVSALVFVHSAVENYWRRKDMRATWLNISHYSPETVCVIFLVGTTHRMDMQDTLLMESRTHRDIIQGDFIDSYRNLTNKGVMGLRWITENCMNAEIVIKVDDDSFINLFKFFENYAYLKNRKRLLFCNVWEPNSMDIIRNKSRKWSVSDTFYLGHERYPLQYCSGFVVFLSTDLVRPLYQAAHTAPFFWIDDVYLFGTLPSFLEGVTFVSFGERLSFQYTKARNCYRHLMRKCKYLVMQVNDGEILEMWKAVVYDRFQSIFGYYYFG